MRRLFLAGLVGAAITILLAVAALYVADLRIVERDSDDPTSPAQAETVYLPTVVGLDTLDATRQLQNLGLEVTETGESFYKETEVASQTPPANTEVDVGSTVTINVQ